MGGTEEALRKPGPTGSPQHTHARPHRGSAPKHDVTRFSHISSVPCSRGLWKREEAELDRKSSMMGGCGFSDKEMGRVLGLPRDNSGVAPGNCTKTEKKHLEVGKIPFLVLIRKQKRFPFCWWGQVRDRTFSVSPPVPTLPPLTMPAIMFLRPEMMLSLS